jgi:hypothetical protein
MYKIGDDNESFLADDRGRSSFMIVQFDPWTHDSVHAYVKGLKKLIIARIERYASNGFDSFISDGSSFKRNYAGTNFMTRIYRGYLAHEGITNDSVSKLQFLVYVYNYFHPLQLDSKIVARFIDSINVRHGKIAHNLVKGKVELIKAEKAKKPLPSYKDYMAAAEPEKPYAANSNTNNNKKRALINFPHN